MWFESKTWLKISACMGVASVLLGGITVSFVNDIYTYTVNKYMVLSPQSVRYEPWRKTPHPLTFRVYLFNWTNPEQVLHSGDKPRLVEVGPYTYSEYDEKVDMQWHSNHTVSYKLIKTWFFEPDKSNGSLDDLITTVDIVSLTAASVAERKNFVFRRFVSLSMAWYSCRAYSTHTAHELLFGGYNDRLLNALSSAIYLSADSETEMFPYDKFGFFYEANGSMTSEGMFNMATGAGNISDVGLLKTWNHTNRTKYITGGCTELRGTSGEVWPLWIDKDDTLSIFTKDLCSPLSLQYEQEQTIQGVSGYRFSPGPGALGSNDSLAAAGTGCQCGRMCFALGVRDISPCKFGSPMFLSFPHFYQADPYLVRQLEGVIPDPTKHKFSIVIEPDTGIPLEILGRTQFSMLLEPKRYNGLFQQVPTVLLPVMWVEVEWRLGPDKAAELSLLLGMRYALRLACLVLVGLGAAATSICTLLMARRLLVTRDIPMDTTDRETIEKEKESLMRNDIPMVVNLATYRK